MSTGTANPVAGGVRMETAMGARLQRNGGFGMWLPVSYEMETERPTRGMHSGAYRRA